MGAIWGIGTKFQRGDGAGELEVFSDIGQITNISPPESTTDTVETTALDSPDGYEEKIPTIIRNGEATLTLNLDPSDQEQTEFQTDQETRTLRNYRIVFPNDYFYQFSAYVTGFSVGEITPEGVLTATVTLSATGKPGFEKVTPETP